MPHRGLKLSSPGGELANPLSLAPQIPELETVQEPATQALFDSPDSRFFPADELGIPLSIYIPVSYRNKNGKLNETLYKVDKHHRFAPRKFLIHQQGEMGKVLRYSCVQDVPKELHTLFNQHYDRPLLPREHSAKFGALLLSIARYLPIDAIDVTEDQPVRRELTLEERQIIWANNELRPQQSTKIQRQILEYVAKRNVKEIDKKLVEDFLKTPYEDVRVEKGKKLFRLAAEVAVEPVEQGYIDAWDSGLLPRQNIRPETGKLHDLVQARAVPKNPARFIIRHVVKDKYALERTLNLMQSNLQAKAA